MGNCPSFFLKKYIEYDELDIVKHNGIKYPISKDYNKTRIKKSSRLK